MRKVMTRAMRWTIATLIGSAMTAIGCTAPPRDGHTSGPRVPVVADSSVAPAVDDGIARRLVNRIELDNFLRDRRIHVEVADGVVRLTGAVRTPLERERADAIVRAMPGVIDVANDLHVEPPH
jgi:osmotically-inducible protein OsmY